MPTVSVSEKTLERLKKLVVFAGKRSVSALIDELVDFYEKELFDEESLREGKYTFTAEGYQKWSNRILGTSKNFVRRQENH